MLILEQINLKLQRYINEKHSRKQNGIDSKWYFKIPIQIFILLCGVLLFAVFQFQKTPIHFNDKVTQELSTNHKEQYAKWLIYNDSIHQISGQSN